MPGFDGTGPLGMGAMTGRGRGFCISNVLPGASLASWFGRGPGRGLSRGGWRGWLGNDFAAGMLVGLGGYLAHSLWARYCTPQVNREDELNLLKEEAAYLESALEQAKKRIKELENKD